MDDERAIQRLLARYCHTVDDGSWDEFGELWAKDAELSLRGTITTGRDAIRDLLCGKQPPERRGRHITTNMVIDVDGDAGRGISDFLFFGRDPEGEPFLRFVGRYHDEYVRSDGVWRFTRREMVFM